MIYELLFYAVVFFTGMAVWLPIYKYVVSRWVQEATIARIESGDIDLNYLLDEGGVFDSLAERTVTFIQTSYASRDGTAIKGSRTRTPKFK